VKYETLKEKEVECEEFFMFEDRRWVKCEYVHSSNNEASEEF